MTLECDLELENAGQRYRVVSASGADHTTLDLHVPGGTALLNLLRQSYTLRWWWPQALRALPRPLKLRVWLRGRRVSQWSW